MKSLIIGAIALTPTFANAMQCTMNGQSVIDALRDNWGETAQGEPIVLNSERYLQLYANEEKGNFTLVWHGSDGSACIRESGKKYNDIPAEKAQVRPAVGMRL